WRLFMLLEGGGVRIKLVAKVTLDPATGQITTNIDDLPQAPVSRFTIVLQGGDRALLQNPTDCGTHVGSASFTGWSGAHVDLAPTISVTGCSNPQPFSPSASIVPDTNEAGATGGGKVLVDRAAGDQLIDNIHLS